MKSKATPRPWEVIAYPHALIIESDFKSTTKQRIKSICKMKNIVGDQNNEERNANAELIVRAVNCHEKFIQILEQILSELDEDLSVNFENTEINNIKSLLKQAKG